MIKVLLLTFSASVLIVSPAFAQSSAHVEVNNNVNSSSNSNSTTTTRTDITIETNGKVTHYESDKPGSVSVKSVNGESEIKVDGKTVLGSPTNDPELSKQPSLTPTPTIEKELTDEQKEQLNQVEKVLEDIKEKITSLQEKLSSLFD